MSDKQKEFDNIVQKVEPKRPIVKNCLRAFLVGGAICTFAQLLQWIFINYFNYDEKTSVSPTIISIIFLAALFTALGLFDHLSQWAGCGTSVPITGFANSITSASMEHKTEGLVLGSAGNMFRLAGAVIVYGIVSGFIVALIKIIFLWIGGN